MSVNPAPSPRICIVGGGLSGLTAASKLQRLLPNASISIYEAGARVGGVIHSERIGTFLVDHGADMFATNPPGALKLCEELGVSQDLILPTDEGQGAKIVRNGELLPLPEGFVLMRATQLIPMLRTPLLSLRGKIRFLLERWIPARKGERGAEDESISQFVERRMGKEMLDRIVAPLAAGIYTADINRLSMRATMGPIAKMEATYGSLAKATAARRKSGQDSVERNSTGARYSQFRAFPGGMVQLIDALVADLPEDCIQLNSAVTGFKACGAGGWELAVSQQVVTCDEIILATPPRISSNLLKDQCPIAANILTDIEASSVAIVVLGVQRSQIKNPANCFGFVVPLTEKRKILACSFASAKFSGRAKEDEVLIRVFVGGAMQSELLDESDEVLIDLVRVELSELIGLTGEPSLEKVIRWDNAMPQYHVGHQERIKRLEKEIDQIDNLTMVSNAFHGVGIAPLIGQAEKAAESIAKRYNV